MLAKRLEEEPGLNKLNLRFSGDEVEALKRARIYHTDAYIPSGEEERGRRNMGIPFRFEIGENEGELETKLINGINVLTVPEEYLPDLNNHLKSVGYSRGTMRRVPETISYV